MLGASDISLWGAEGSVTVLPNWSLMVLAANGRGSNTGNDIIIISDIIIVIVMCRNKAIFFNYELRVCGRFFIAAEILY
jgi:hypothetical protein